MCTATIRLSQSSTRPPSLLLIYPPPPTSPSTTLQLPSPHLTPTPLVCLAHSQWGRSGVNPTVDPPPLGLNFPVSNWRCAMARGDSAKMVSSSTNNLER